ncbi:cytochrome ubiquinol oxidase subunit I [Glycomyces sp. TRM65418]|uniref:cytochrome ubiquinol oxidase subunit I n=1 Tax=Glycomyces sp. TRM65418 TaxID=2867006 RepID=UPI001CE528BF|nr:cytochrome ubiquinol oxidase subunit I [Glycomyces sp. TRM65418]MCC3765027.1 cytochrome ubiquinol oxidase subunit I [Glycomyces sp. TRM65418]QZD54656.1 cytochrome ubiquinol oxidase subunit I [Glycomyces sp. TRM65418]
MDASQLLAQAADAVAADPAGLMPARQQMALSLGWHIILACFGVSFPAIIFVMHLRGIRRKDPVALDLAKRWSKVSAVLFAIGAVSGTVLSFEMGLLWPGLMGTYGDVLGLPFAFEGLAFFLEAIFIGIYLYGWGRMPPKVHLLMLLPMAITGVFGTYCVLAVNAWMNHPVGFNIVDGQIVDVEPWAVMFNSQAFMQFAHMWVGAYMVAGFSIAAVYAAGMLRGRRDRHHRLGFVVPFAFATIAALAQPFVGHFLGEGLEERQPSKLAAFELAETTDEGASPLRIGGVLIEGEVKGAIEIPYLGSIIALGSLDEPVPGLDQIPDEDQPPVNLTHWAFQTMIGIGLLLMAAVALFWFLRWRRRDLLEHRWFLRFASTAGVLAVIALESGWIATEVGRQPWIVYGVMRTNEAAADHSAGLWGVYGASVVLYGAMTVGAIVVLRSMARRWRAGAADLPSPYGPQSRLRDRVEDPATEEAAK